MMNSFFSRLFISLVLSLGIPLCALAAQIFVINYPSEANAKVFVTKYQSEANCIVYDTQYSSDNEPGVWFYTKYKSEADLIVYFTKYKSDARCRY